MKGGGKEQEEQSRSVGPMFPRLHVNDAVDKGGPRAPPRNKMALYEQFSIPTQRFNHRTLPPSHNGVSNAVPPASSSQRSGSDKNTLYPLHLPPSTPAHLSEKFTVHKPNAAKTSTSTLLLKSRKRAQAGEEFMVPVLVRLRAALGRGQSGTVRSTSDHSAKTLNDSKKDSGQDSQNRDARGQHCVYPDRLQDEPLVDTEKVIGSRQRNDLCMDEVPRMPIEGDDGNCDFSRERMIGSPVVDVIERGNDVSATSMVYSVSEVDVSPDDVVGIIGQTQFWKARRALVNQQRVFAVQVFELHRLIKVQQLIAESPHILVEDVSLKTLPQIKFNMEITKPLLQNTERREDPEKQCHRIEQSAENGVSKTSFSEIRSHRPLVGDTRFVPVAPDHSKTGFWAHHQQPAPKHQWLIPVMSPSEGLVYKPYPGPEYMGPYNGPGPTPTPFTNSFMGPPYGVPAHFPTYGAPIMGSDFSGSSVEQINRFHQWPEEDPDRNLQHQSSCNEPRQKSGPTPLLEKFRETEFQGSTGSSPSERPTKGQRGAFQLFPMAPRVSSWGSEPPENSQQHARVIKVIPHNRRSATESAARIFRSIQEERKLYD